MRYNKNAKRYCKITVLVCLCILLLTGCEGELLTITRKNADGTTTTMECVEVYAFLNRGTHQYHMEDEKIIMQYGSLPIEAYTAEIISKEEKEAYDSKKILGKSTNLTAYEANDNDKDHKYTYVYILDLQGTDDSYIKFSSSAAPGEKSTDNNFAEHIKYYVDGQETIPVYIEK
ncbi:MAG: hypothetical protein HDT40_04355 [Lachnospiraceae bacterium]|nr:hypothetical protein [Lachnospiraceae bacterium]